MLENTKLQELVKSYVKDNTEAEEALAELKRETRYQIQDYLDNLYEDDAYYLLHSYCEDLHEMADLDYEFEDMSVTEVLTELSDIDVNDDYFNADTKESGNNMWEVAQVDSHELARALWNGDIRWEEREYEGILAEYEQVAAGIHKYYEAFNKARALFEKLLIEDPDAVITALWNLNSNS